MKQKTDTEMLDWCAEYLMEVEIINHKVKGERIRITANDAGDIHSFEGEAASIKKAFRKAVCVGMQTLPSR